MSHLDQILTKVSARDLRIANDLLEQGFSDEDLYAAFTPAKITVRREYGKTPNGNNFGGMWVLRKDGQYIDHDKYRHDLAERNQLELK